MPRYFDDDLPRVNADKIKPMVKMWGGNYKMNKYDCIDFIVANLKDPLKVRAAIASLEPWERNALAIIKRMGGIIHNSTLKVGIFASGLHPRRTYSYREDFVDPLFRRGLILATGGYGPDSISENYGSGGILYSDERLLAQVGQPEYVPLEIQPIEPQGEIHFRRPSAVTLDVMGMLQAIENMGGLKLTQNGTVRVNDETKLRKAMRWDEKGMDVDGFLFPNPVQAWLGAFGYSDILKKTADGQLVLKETPEQFANRPFNEQIRLLMEGFLRTRTWWEIPDKSNYLDSDGKGRNQGRLALTMALASLPFKPEAFFSFRGFEQALYNRIGEDFALDYPPRRPYSYISDDSAKQKQELLKWQQSTRADWLKQEFPWLVGAFHTWLYFLGLVELVMDNGKLAGFRLTEIGRATFHPELATVSTAETHIQISNQPAWIVQPNFDIITYLDRVSAPQLAFLERCAERTESHKHTAHYRLTRESVYRGLESGTSLDELIATLQTGSQTALSQNILVELREWASLRERIILRRRTRLLEFPTPGALKTALSHGLIGTIVAERFLLLDAAPPASGWTTIDYAKPLPQNLTITETGLIHWKPGSHDLVTASQLNQWAEPTADDGWQLSRENISNAIKPGRKITELLTLLNNRLVPNQPTSKYMPPAPPIPPLLELALRSWAGKEYPVELESVIVLRCPHEQLFQAILGSSLLRPLLKGYQHPDLLFIRPEAVPTLREQLTWLAWDVSEQLHVSQLGKH